MDLKQISEEKFQVFKNCFQDLLVEHFGDKFRPHEGGFILALVGEKEIQSRALNGKVIKIDVQFMTNFDIGSCPHCYTVVKLALERGIKGMPKEATGLAEQN